MRGRIFKKYRSSWTIVISLDRDSETGKRKQKWLSVKGSKKMAEKKLTELLFQMDGGASLDTSKLALGDYLKMWLNDLKPSIAPRSFERYEGIIGKYIIPHIGDIPLDSLTPQLLQSHYTETINGGLSARTVHNHHVVIHHALKTALRRGLVVRNVADAVDPPRFTKPEMNVWEMDDFKRFLKFIEGHFMYALFYLALFTGMRRSELLGLQWRDIDFEARQLSVNRALVCLKDNSFIYTQPKTTGSRRVIALSPSTLIVLKEHRNKHPLDKDTDRVFRPDDTEYWNHNRVTYEWHKACIAAGVKLIRLHDARHTHASILLKQKVHPKIVQERLGHASIQMTLDTYSHLIPSMQDDVAIQFDETVLQS
jgi:integrase